MVCARLILASATFLVFLPEPHGQGAFLPILGPIRLYVQEMVAGFFIRAGISKVYPAYEIACNPNSKFLGVESK